MFLHNLKDLNVLDDVPVPLDLEKEPKREQWAEEDADEDDIKESWEDEEPTPVFFIYAFFEAEFIRGHWQYIVYIHSAIKIQVFSKHIGY